MNLLVAGGAGYIGSITGEVLIEAGHRVTVLDNFVTGHRGAVPPDAELLEVDLADAGAVDLALRTGPYDAVLHFGALIQVGESMTDPGRYFASNVANTLTLLEACRRHAVPRFVFSSTGTVYAEPAPLPITEDAPLAPGNPYAESKLMVERMLGWYSAIHGLRCGILRYFNAAGASQRNGEAHEPESHLVPNVLRVAAGEADTLTLHGTDYPTPDGSCVRDYVHVLDLAEAHRLALDALDRAGSFVVNLGSETGHSNREVIEAARRITGRSIAVVQGPRRPGDAVAMVASSARARELLGWQPRHASLDAMIGSAWDWKQRHPSGYES